MGGTMRAAVFESTGLLVVRDVAEPAVRRPEDVKVRVEAVGICGTDVHITSVPPGYEATPGTILGHEFCGRVVETGSAVTHVSVGDRVVINPNDYCGVCEPCRTQRPNLCERIVAIGIHADGAFAQYWVGSGKLAFRISDAVPVAHAAFAEMLADVVAGTRRASLRPGETAVIIGLGPIGHLFAQLLRASGAGTVVLVDGDPKRAAFARQLGWEHVVEAHGPDGIAAIWALTDGGADVVVDAAGSALGSAVAVARPGGRVVVFGVNTRAVADVPQASLTMKELQVYGAWLANGTFPEAVRLLEAGALDLDPLITHHLPLEQIHAGLDLLKRREALKVLIEP